MDGRYNVGEERPGVAVWHGRGLQREEPDTPYKTAYFHDSQLPRDVEPTLLPSYGHMFDFKIVESAHGEGALEARHMIYRGWLPS